MRTTGGGGIEKRRDMRRAGIDRSRLHRRIPGPLPGADLDGSRTRAGGPQGIARTDDCRARAPPVCARSGRAHKVGGGLRVGVGVERLRVAASVGALFGIGIVLCVTIVRTLAGVVGVLYPIPGRCVTHARIVKMKNGWDGR